VAGYSRVSRGRGNRGYGRPTNINSTALLLPFPAADRARARRSTQSEFFDLFFSLPKNEFGTILRICWSTIFGDWKSVHSGDAVTNKIHCLSSNPNVIKGTRQDADF
jgi:hypothetical protein